MTAAQRPLLKPGLRFSRHESDGTIAWVVKNPETRKYFRFGQVEAWLMQRMDGARTLQQMCDELRSDVGVNAAPHALDVFVRRLREMGLVERTLEERSALLLEHLRARRRIRNEDGSTLLRLRFSVGDPDRLLHALAERMPFFWTRGFLAVSAVVFATYFIVIAANWSWFVSVGVLLYSPSQMTLGIFLIMYGSFAVTAAIHEVGHGATCRRYGGEVHEMGVMLLYFMPAFYCNVSDAWTFEKRAHRIWVTLAGGWIQMWVAALAALVWLWTAPGTLTNTIALYTTVINGGYAVLLNYNPLIPLDGYYALVDALEIPNLRQRSFAYTAALARQRLLGLDTVVPAVTPRERRIFLAYGILAALYTTLILTAVAVLAGSFLGARFGAWGWACFALLVLLTTRELRSRAAELARTFITQKMPPHGRARRAAVAGVILLAASVFAAATPWTTYATARVMVEPERRVWLRPPADARLLEVLAQEGQLIEAGETVAVLRDARLDVEIAQSRAAYGELAARAEAARALRDVAAAEGARIAAEAERARLDLLTARRDALVLRAPETAVLVTPRLHERIGERVTAGDSLIEMWAGDPRARIHLDQRSASGVVEGTRVRIRFPADHAHTWRTRVERIEPAATSQGVVLLATLPAGAAATVRAGMSGRARVTAERTTIAGAIARKWRHTVRGDLFL